MAEIAGLAIEVVKIVVAPVIRHFSYLCCFSSNIKNLRDEAENLDDAKKGLQIRVDRAKNDVQVILPEVQTWIEDYNQQKIWTTNITNKVPNVESGCLKLPSRYRLSRKAKKQTADMKELREKCKFGSISEPSPPAAREAIPTGTTYNFESRKHIEEDIMTSLRGMDTNTIGICGMGGIGKTTMAKRIMNKALEERLFDEVVIVVISQQVDISKIQLEIGGSLGLKLEGESSQARVQKLRARLTNTRKILLVVDDVWKRLAFEELGIPCESGSKGFTILLTSRNMDVLRAMNVGKICGLQILSKEESWFLFREKAGACVDDNILNPIAKQVTSECKGLPIALAAVGVALNDENDLSIWKDALVQLRKSNPSDIPNIITEVYNPLRLSYDYLDNDHAKSMFLLCCLFAEDGDIPLEHLTYFAMGLCLFEEIWTLEEVRGRTRILIKMLKTRFLLIEGSDEDHVKMHDVVRDVSIFIASKEKFGKGSDCTWISSFVDGRGRLAVESGFPNLNLLYIDEKVEQEIQINGKLFRGTKELNVLFIKYGLLKSLPHTTQLLKSLTTLALYNCESLETISVIGQLESLEILICQRCGSIKELPVQVRGLRQLRLLEISKCFTLKRVAPGVIASLVKLEELKIVKSFEKWEGEVEEGKGRKNAGLRELEHLMNLKCLEIQVLDSTLAALPLRLSPQLVKFNVQFGADLGLETPETSYHRIMTLDFPVGTNYEGDLSTRMLMSSTEYLAARANHYAEINLNLANAQSLKWLALDGFKNTKNITSSAASFPFLEFLLLKKLEKLEEIWDAPIPSNSFHNLKELRLEHLPELRQLGKSPHHNHSSVELFSNLSTLYVDQCRNLGNLFSSATTSKDRLLQRLESITIAYCDKMEHVVLLQNEEEYKGNDIMIFPKLKSLSLNYMSNLTSICRGIQSIEFPLLADLTIVHCEKMRCLVSSSDDENKSEEEHYGDQDSLHLLCQPKVSFPNLKKLSLKGRNHWLQVSFPNLKKLSLEGRNVECKNVWCDQVPIAFFTGLVELHIDSFSKIRRLFSSSSKIPQNLVNLQKLKIWGCKEMVKVIEDDDEDVSSSSSCDHPTNPTTTPLFPSLQEIELWRLPKLDSFCEWRCALELPSLKKLEIRDCDEMKSFNAGTPALQTVTINGQDLESVDDLNAALHQHFEKAKVTTFANLLIFILPLGLLPILLCFSACTSFSMLRR